MHKERLYDVIIVGGGPAGLTAALYLARACYRVLVLERESFGGQITITSEIVNYPGVEKTSGRELTENMQRQGESFGAEFLLAEVKTFDLQGDIKTLGTDKGDFYAFGVLLATGAHPRMAGFPGEREFRGRGVAYCATCDGEFFRNREVYVIGGGFAAAEESVFLTRYAKHVTVLIRGEGFSCAEATARAALSHPNITVLTHTEVAEAKGEAVLTALKCRNNQTGEEISFGGDAPIGVFVFAGYEPATKPLQGIIDLTEEGYIVTDAAGLTSLPGVYAAGDVRVKKLRQVVTAVGDGAAAATALEKYAADMQKKTGIIPQKPVAKTAEAAPEAKDSQAGPFSREIIGQLHTVFSRMTDSLILSLSLDNRSVSGELRIYMDTLAQLTDKLTVGEASEAVLAPAVRILRQDKSWTGLAFHGVPGGHEFTSFVLGLYNAAGPGQPVAEDLRQKIALLPPMKLDIFVSLSCTMCPELVTSAQRLATLHSGITAEVYDLSWFPEFKEKYNIMSVPCLVVNDTKVMFGKKSLAQLVEALA